MNDNELMVKSYSNSIVDVAFLSSIGDREDQQDSFGCSLCDDSGLFVICDGMGGLGNGDLASRTAVDCFISNYENSNPILDNVAFLQQNTFVSNDLVSNLTNKNGEKISVGTTLVSVIINKTELFWSSVGDSRVYLYRNGDFVQITQDHNYNTVLTEQLNMGMIDKEEFDKENQTGEALISYLGIGEMPLIDYNYSALQLFPNDKVLLMSDGLYKILSDFEFKTIIENFTNVIDAVNALEKMTQKKAVSINKKRDNMTISLIQIK